MNKMIKGAAFAGLGVALLLGGGGTLANWNVSDDSRAGIISTGDLNLVASDGKWTKNGEAIDPTSYRVVPGETLTYQQAVTVTVQGDELQAELTVSGVSLDDAVTLDGPYLTDPAGARVDGTIIGNSDVPQQLIATATFAFRDGITGRQGAAKTFNLDKVGYQLTQVADTNNN
ncbi:alternate-type signal peptide domain-containing protein [Tessaracoccus oleiagri]|uniref:Alternate signal-mediated exported protein, RER_14450 family n=1 Tax=Tessaracoccus oleiagri TaxID=686624 RepID=A0A1G9KP65_9ACTN|nr:alternate-type signal peptide domain-containing protein [Tessaracoccus oleiagri]SDL51165.1 alternate signal-mediated exported protein, RER_14450 family [Tessaracoccus oleiagri]